MENKESQQEVTLCCSFTWELLQARCPQSCSHNSHSVELKCWDLCGNSHWLNRVFIFPFPCFFRDASTDIHSIRRESGWHSSKSSSLRSQMSPNWAHTQPPTQPMCKMANNPSICFLRHLEQQRPHIPRTPRINKATPVLQPCPDEE